MVGESLVTEDLAWGRFLMGHLVCGDVSVWGTFGEETFSTVYSQKKTVEHSQIKKF